jgi:hypothetical protein
MSDEISLPKIAQFMHPIYALISSSEVGVIEFRNQSYIVCSFKIGINFYHFNERTV